MKLYGLFILSVGLFEIKPDNLVIVFLLHLNDWYCQ